MFQHFPSWGNRHFLWCFWTPLSANCSLICVRSCAISHELFPLSLLSLRMTSHCCHWSHYYNSVAGGYFWSDKNLEYCIQKDSHFCEDTNRGKCCILVLGGQDTLPLYNLVIFCCFGPCSCASSRVTHSPNKLRLKRTKLTLLQRLKKKPLKTSILNLMIFISDFQHNLVPEVGSLKWEFPGLEGEGGLQPWGREQIFSLCLPADAECRWGSLSPEMGLTHRCDQPSLRWGCEILIIIKTNKHSKAFDILWKIQVIKIFFFSGLWVLQTIKWKV